MKLLKGRKELLEIAVSHLKKSQDLVWIDLGGGTGWNIEQMDQVKPISDFKAVYLVDLSPSLCDVARKRFKAKGWKNVHVICIDVHEFELPKEAGKFVDLLTLSYSLSMIPNYYSLVDRVSSLMSRDTILAVVDFYVQADSSFSDKSTWIGGELHRHVSWLSRTFWRVWFEFDRVYLDSSRRDYLEYRFGTIKSVNMRNYNLGGIPYYLWVGCDKDYNSDLTLRLNALATESPYLAPKQPQEKEEATENAAVLYSKGYEAALINMERNLPYPSFFFQKEIWRVFYDCLDSKYHQFSSQYIYAFTWEDPREDTKILNINEKDTVLAITSAGDNILSYLSLDRPPRRVHGVDLNPQQGHLVELKLASLRALPYDDHWKLFGIGKHENFKELLLKKLAPHMSSHAFQFWMIHGEKTFSSGGRGLYDTGFTRWALRIARWLFTIAGKQADVDRLCKAKTMPEQLQIWNEKLKPVLFNPLVSMVLIGNPIFLWKALGVPVNQMSMIQGGIMKYLVDTIEPLLHRSLISSDNYFYYLCLQGKYSKMNCPDYLTTRGYENLTSKRRNVLDNVRLHTDTIQDVMERITPGTVTCAIVMDHMDWFSPKDNAAREEIRALNTVLAKGGRVLIRSSSTHPWYINAYEREGFKCRPAAVRRTGESIDRVNMYASTWVATKYQDCDDIEELEL